MKFAYLVPPFLFISSSLSALQDDVPGSWVKSGEFAQVNAFCRQRWVCRPNRDQIYSSEYQLRGPEPQTTWGTCSAGGGDTSSCNHCVASEPEEPCVLRLERRE